MKWVLEEVAVKVVLSFPEGRPFLKPAPPCRRSRVWRMAMGKKKRRQDALWIVASDLPKSAGHPFYHRLNVLLEANGFDRFTERVCERFYADGIGRPSLPPGRYFRLLLL